MSLKILTPEKMRETEQRAIRAGYPSLLLMEHAAARTVEVLEKELGGCAGKNVLFLCGKGNNGGDGLAAARLFKDRGGKPVVFLTGEPATADAGTNLLLARMNGIPVTDVSRETDAPLYRPENGWDAYVDAIFGTGFHGTPDPVSALLIALPDDELRSVPVIAVDVPSGLDAASGESGDTVMRATVTVTFHAVKPGLLLTSARDAVGRVECVPIGLDDLDEEILPYEETPLLAGRGDLVLPRRSPGCHKGDMGRVLIYAGSMGMAGAAAVCADAAVRAGAGLTTLVCERELIPILQTLVPCAMCRDIRDAVDDVPCYDVFCTGCGLGQSEQAFQNILRLWDPEKPSVWDADALNLLALHPMRLGEMAVMTPHVGEAARLLGISCEAVLRDRMSAAGQLSRKFGCNAVLKSDVTVVCRPGEAPVLIACGTPALAKGGSGDALSGILAALYAQEAPDPAVNAPLWHALASVVGAEKYGTAELTARELLLCLHEAEKRYTKAETESNE